MAKLSAKDLAGLKLQPTATCQLCKQTLHNDYCETCDEFFGEGHKAACKFMKVGKYGTDDHRRHYTALRDPIVRDVNDDGLAKFFTPEQILYSPKFWK